MLDYYTLTFKGRPVQVRSVVTAVWKLLNTVLSSAQRSIKQQTYVVSIDNGKDLWWSVSIVFTSDVQRSVASVSDWLVLTSLPPLGPRHWRWCRWEEAAGMWLQAAWCVGGPWQNCKEMTAEQIYLEVRKWHCDWPVGIVVKSDWLWLEET